MTDDMIVRLAETADGDLGLVESKPQCFKAPSSQLRRWTKGLGREDKGLGRAHSDFLLWIPWSKDLAAGFLIIAKSLTRFTMMFLAQGLPSALRKVASLQSYGFSLI